jgi:hypothetical protein
MQPYKMGFLASFTSDAAVDEVHVEGLWLPDHAAYRRFNPVFGSFSPTSLALIGQQMTPPFHSSIPTPEYVIATNWLQDFRCRIMKLYERGSEIQRAFER